jgi:hypothetical protein
MVQDEVLIGLNGLGTMIPSSTTSSKPSSKNTFQSQTLPSPLPDTMEAGKKDVPKKYVQLARMIRGAMA